MSAPYRCCIVGCGAIGGGYGGRPERGWALTHAGAYRLCAGTRLQAAADPDAGARAAFGRRWEVRRLYADYREMLAAERPDILSICLPTGSHLEVLEAACRAGVRAVFCEKPLAYELGEAARMVRLAAGLTASVNYFRRWNPDLAALREELRGGRYGRVLHVVARYTKGLYGNASHLVDLARWFWGEPSSVRRLRAHASGGSDPGVDFRMDFPKGFSAHVLHVPGRPYVFIDVDILAERGRVVIGQRGQRLERFRVSREPHFRAFDIVRRVSEKETSWRGCMVSAVRELVYCLKTGGRTSCTLADGLAALRLCRRAAGARTNP